MKIIEWHKQCDLAACYLFNPLSQWDKELFYSGEKESEQSVGSIICFKNVSVVSRYEYDV
jgi:hypothetical protein